MDGSLLCLTFLPPRFPSNATLKTGTNAPWIRRNGRAGSGTRSMIARNFLFGDVLGGGPGGAGLVGVQGPGFEVA